MDRTFHGWFIFDEKKRGNWKTVFKLYVELLDSFYTAYHGNGFFKCFFDSHF